MISDPMPTIIIVQVDGSGMESTTLKLLTMLWA